MSDFLKVLFHSNAIEKQRMHMFFIFLIYINFHCWSSCSHQQITIFYTKGNKRLLMNLFQGQFAPLHYVSLLYIILDEKCTPIYANGRFLVLFFSPRNACISTVYHSTRKMHAHLRERKISCSFFSPRKKKLWSPRKRTWRPTIHISCLQSSQELEEKYVPYNKQLSGKT